MHSAHDQSRQKTVEQLRYVFVVGSQGFHVDLIVPCMCLSACHVAGLMVLSQPHMVATSGNVQGGGMECVATVRVLVNWLTPDHLLCLLFGCCSL